MLVTLSTTRRVAKLSVATLFWAMTLAMATAMPAGATPIYSVCYPGVELGYYEWYADSQGNFTDSIGINDCALESMGAGPEDYQRVLEHELGHAQGLSHSDAPSDTMYPELYIWGT